MSLKNTYFYPEAESSVSLKIKLFFGSRMYNYTIVSVLVSTFTSELIKKRKKKKHSEEKQGLSPVRLKDVIVFLHDTSIFHSKGNTEISVMIKNISLNSALDPILF